MTPEITLKLRRSLILHEGYKRFPHLDTAGKITIGIGYNLTDCGIDDEWISRQYQLDVNFFFNKLSQFEWFQELNLDRQIILIDMAFMGWKKFLSFKKMLQALSEKDYEVAAKEMLNSKWAEQVKGRAIDLAEGMCTGIYNI